MKSYPIITITFCIVSAIVWGQGNVKELTRSGLMLLDEGKYMEAIKSYSQALEVNPKSVIANYEISTAYLEIKDYKNAEKYSSIAMELDKKIYLKAALIKGNALYNLGKPYDAIDVYKKTLKKTKEAPYLVYHDLALVYWSLNDYKNAEDALRKGLSDNLYHAPSHLLLGEVMEAINNRIQSILCLHYFLFLEPNTQRSATAYARLKKLLGQNTKKEGNTTKYSPENALRKEIEYGAADILLYTFESSKNQKENKNKSDFELFVENTKALFQLLGEMDEERENIKKDIWHQLYIPFFYKLSQSDYMNVYCRFISTSFDYESKQWMEANEDKVATFFTWLNEK